MAYRDDPSISNADTLWRRIPPRWIIWDDNAKRFRPSSAAFENDQDGMPMSVYVERLVRLAGASEATVLEGHPHFGLASITAGFVRAHKQAIALERAAIPGHAVVVGEKKKATCRAFAKSAIWIFNPQESR